MRRRLVALVTIALVVACAPAAGARREGSGWIVRDLGTIAGGHSEAVAINERGQVIGTSMSPRQEYVSGFVWRSGRMVDLGTLGAPEGTYPFAIDDRGRIAGWSSRADAARRIAFLWQDGTMTDLGTLGGNESVALALDGKGAVVGWAATKRVRLGQQLAHAFLWKNGRMTDLGTLPGGSESWATATNGRGQVVGESEVAGGRHHAVLWQGRHAIDLGVLPGWSSSEAVGINRRGQVVGSMSTPTGRSRAFLWADGKLVALRDPPGTRNSVAVAVNDSGQVLGYGFDRVDGRSGDRSGVRYVLWQGATLRDLGAGTDGGVRAAGLSAQGRVVGMTEAVRPFVWSHGARTLLPGLPGTSAVAINGSDQVVGTVVVGTAEWHAALWTRAAG